MLRVVAIAALAALTWGCAARDVGFSAFPRLYGPRPWPAFGWSDPYWGPAGDPLWRMDLEQRLQDQCMRSRGYDLQ